MNASGAGFNVNPTSITFGALLFAFIFYATVKGDLGKWFGIFGLAQQPASGAGSALFGAGSGFGSGAGSDAGSGSVPAIGGFGGGTLGNITGGTGSFSQLSGGDTGWMNTTGQGGGDTGWINTGSALSGGDTGWVDAGGGDTGWIAT